MCFVFPPGDTPHIGGLSLGGCQLNDVDVQPIWDAVKAGRLPIAMLKLSANRISDKGVVQMCEALQSQKTHPLALIDLSNNNVNRCFFITKGDKINKTFNVIHY